MKRLALVLALVFIATPLFAQAVSITTLTKTKLKESPSVYDTEALAWIPEGTKLTLMDYDHAGYWKTEYQGKAGYISDLYVRPWHEGAKEFKAKKAPPKTEEGPRLKLTFPLESLTGFMLPRGGSRYYTTSCRYLSTSKTPISLGGVSSTLVCLGWRMAKIKKAR